MSSLEIVSKTLKEPKAISPTVDSIASTKKNTAKSYLMAAAQMESLNSLYKVQLESASKTLKLTKKLLKMLLN